MKEEEEEEPYCWHYSVSRKMPESRQTLTLCLVGWLVASPKE